VDLGTSKLQCSARAGVRNGWEGFVWMMKIIVPVSFCTALLEYSGLLGALNVVLKPAMGMLYLPPIAAVPLVLGTFTVIYAGIAAMVALPLTMDEMTLIAVFLMISHSLIQESIIQAKSGLGAFKAVFVRLVTAIVAVIVVAQFLEGGSRATTATVSSLSSTQPFFVMLQAWLLATLSLLGKIFLIIMVIMIVLQIMKDYNVIECVVKLLKPFLKVFGLEQKAGMLWLTAVVFGLAYGGAVIVGEAKTGSFTRAELENLQISIGINHAVFEDTALFMSVGLNAFWLLVPRIVAAIIAVQVVSLWRKIRERSILVTLGGSNESDN
jgi:hypothetical protein